MAQWKILCIPFGPERNVSVDTWSFCSPQWFQFSIKRSRICERILISIIGFRLRFVIWRNLKYFSGESSFRAIEG